MQADKTFHPQVLDDARLGDQLLLAENLLARMDYSDRTGQWSLKGNVTKAEYGVLTNWFRTLQHAYWRVKNARREGKEA